MRAIIAGAALVVVLLAGCGGSSSAKAPASAAAGAAPLDARIAAMVDAAREAPGPSPRIAALARPAVRAAIAGPLALSGSVAAPPADPGGAYIVRVREPIEFAVIIDGGSWTAPYDPDAARGGLDLSATFRNGASERRVAGFFDGAQWRIRFAPEATGAWTCSLRVADASGAATAEAPSFTCVGASTPGWIRISGRFLADSAGGAFFPLGHNTGWQYDVWHPSPAAMAANGENLLSFWLCVPWADPTWASASEPWWSQRASIAQSRGGGWTYNQDACAYLDVVIAAADANGIRLWPSLWSHGELRADGHPWGAGWWSNNPYAAVCSASDFFRTTSGGVPTEQWRLQQNFFRYLIARWGHSTAIAGWVGLVEAEGTTGWIANPGQVEAWCGAVTAWFRANDPYRRSASGAYPIVTSRSNAPAWDSRADMRATDRYGSEQYSNTLIAAACAADTRTMTASSKPSFHSEFGGDVTRGASQPTHFHNGLWAGFAAGACMTPQVWTDGGSFPLMEPATVTGQDMLTTIARLRDFTDQLDLLADPLLTNLALSVTSAKAWGMRRGHAGFAWVYADSGVVDGRTLVLTGLPANTTISLQWFDTWTGVWRQAAQKTTRRGELSAKIPVIGRRDIALRFAPQVIATR